MTFHGERKKRMELASKKLKFYNMVCLPTLLVNKFTLMNIFRK